MGVSLQGIRHSERTLQGNHSPISTNRTHHGSKHISSCSRLKLPRCRHPQSPRSNVDEAARAQACICSKPGSAAPPVGMDLFDLFAIPGPWQKAVLRLAGKLQYHVSLGPSGGTTPCWQKTVPYLAGKRHVVFDPSRSVSTRALQKAVPNAVAGKRHVGRDPSPSCSTRPCWQ
jgi:hypothetical protein